MHFARLTYICLFIYLFFIFFTTFEAKRDEG